MNSRYYLTFKSTFLYEKPKKFDKTSLMVNFLIWIICILLHWPKKLPLVGERWNSLNQTGFSCVQKTMLSKKNLIFRTKTFFHFISKISSYLCILISCFLGGTLTVSYFPSIHFVIWAEKSKAKSKSIKNSLATNLNVNLLHTCNCTSTQINLGSFEEVGTSICFTNWN